MMLAALPRRSWNMIYQRALVLGVHRSIYVQEGIPSNITVDDLNVIPDIDVALRLVAEASKRRKKTEFQAYAVWLYSAGLDEFADEIEHRNINSGSSPSPFHSDSNEDRLRAGRASICRLWYALEGSWLAYAAPSWGSRRCRK